MTAFRNRLCGWLLDLEIQQVDTSVLKERDAHASRLALIVATFILNQNSILVLRDSALTEKRHVCFDVAAINAKFLASGFDLDFDFPFVFETSTICAFG